MTTACKTYKVDPARLAWGSWSHEKNRQIGEGDISASYSADRIGQNQPVRKPFRHDGKTWVTVGKCGVEAKGYALIHPSGFSEPSFTYAEARQLPRPELGFYHGMRVRHRGQDMILVGPEAKFIEGEPEQMSLF